MTALRAALLATLCGCASSTTVRLPGDRDAAAPPASGARYAWRVAAPSCYAPMGRVELADGRWCAGVLIGASRVLTTESCLRDRTGTNHLPARDITFRIHGADRGTPALRVAHLRDADDDRSDANLSVITLAARVLAGDRAAPTASVRDAPALPDDFALASYGGSDATTLRVSPRCGVTRDDGATLTHGCDLDAPVAGAALIECAGDQATVYAIDPGDGGALVSVRGLNALPLNPRSVALGPGVGGRPVAWAFDDDTARLHVRVRGATGWGPWRVLPGARAPDDARAGSLTAFALYGGESSVAFHERGAALQYRWAFTGEPERFTDWSPYTSSPDARRFVSIASSGGAREPAQVYALGDRGEVVTQYKTDAASSADWSPWCSLGVVATATRLAAVSFAGTPTERAYQVFAATPSGVLSRWAPGASGACASWWPPDGWHPLGDGLSEPVAAVGAGVLGDGRPFVLSVMTSGQVRYTERFADGTAWARDAAFPVAGIVRDVAVGALADEAARARAAVLAIAGEGTAPGTSTGEMLYVEESGAGGFTGARWRRFYR